MKFVEQFLHCTDVAMQQLLVLLKMHGVLFAEEVRYLKSI